MATLAEVRLWGRRVGAVALEDGERAASFQYDPDFLASNIKLAPLQMPPSPRPYRFPALGWDAFKGLPGMLADSLPDRFGNDLIDAWLAGQGRSPDSFNAVERLCYIGTRGLGALEFAPPQGPEREGAGELEVAQLVELASEALARKELLDGSLGSDRSKAVADILAVGTSAGGARPKAVIAFNPDTLKVRSGQVSLPAGYEHWLLKFDGVTDKNPELALPQGYGAVEHAYALMAKAAGITMPETRLLEEGGRRHFMVRRFDRTATGDKLHMQSLAALAHLDFNQSGAHTYETAFYVIRELGLGMGAIEEQYRRMVFNLVARNQDDHVKNIAFIMDREGRWALSPAYDVAFAYNANVAQNPWTIRHQMSVNGKRDDFTRADLEAVAKTAAMSKPRALAIAQEVVDAVGRWPEFAADVAVDPARAQHISSVHRLDLLTR